MSEKNVARRASDSTIRRMVGLFAARRGTLALAAALTVGVVVGTLLLPVLTGQAVDCVVGPGEVNFGGLYRALASIAVTLVATAICQWSLTAVTKRLGFGAALGLG